MRDEPAPSRRLRAPARSAIACLALSCALAGCGDYIKLSDDADGSVAGGSLEDFPTVDRLSHYQLSALLAPFVQRKGQFVLLDYDGLAADKEALYLLDRYRAMLAAVDPSDLRGPDQRFAYWVNGYNASVIRGVIAKYRGKHTFKVIDSAGFFSQRRYTFAGIQLSLDQVEHVITRGKLDHAAAAGVDAQTKKRFETWHRQLWPDGKVDARLHAAFNCAALSCPNLLATDPYVYDPATLDKQLEAQITSFLDSAKGASGTGISSLFDWYGQDFVDDAGSVDKFIAKHRTKGTSGIDTDRFLDYDWTLNIEGN